MQKLSQFKQTFTSIPLKSDEKRNKRKNVQKAKKRKKAETRCKDVYEKIVMSLLLKENTTFSMKNDVSKHSLNIEAMACDVTSHDSKAPVELKERGVFIRPAWNLLTNLVPSIVQKKICALLFPNEDGLVIDEDDTDDDSADSENEAVVNAKMSKFIL